MSGKHPGRALPSLPRLHPGRAVLHQTGREVPGARAAGLRSQCGSVRRHAVQPRPLRQRRDVRGLGLVCVVSALPFLKARCLQRRAVKRFIFNHDEALNFHS